MLIVSNEKSRLSSYFKDTQGLSSKLLIHSNMRKVCGHIFFSLIIFNFRVSNFILVSLQLKFIYFPRQPIFFPNTYVFLLITNLRKIIICPLYIKHNFSYIRLLLDTNYKNIKDSFFTPRTILIRHSLLTDV